jgi:hypothetical protein
MNPLKTSHEAVAYALLHHQHQSIQGDARLASATLFRDSLPVEAFSAFLQSSCIPLSTLVRDSLRCYSLRLHESSDLLPHDLCMSQSARTDHLPLPCRKSVISSVTIARLYSQFLGTLRLELEGCYPGQVADQRF